MRDGWVKSVMVFLIALTVLNTVGVLAISQQTPSQQATTETVIATTTANQTELNSLMSQVSQLSNAVSNLQATVNQESNKIDILQIPIIVRDNLGPSDIIANYLVNPVIGYVKNKTGLDVGIASGTIKTIIQSKLTRPDVELVNASWIQGHLYNVNIRLVIPFSLSEVPIAATAVNLIGDLTFYPYITFSAQVDVANASVSNIQYTGYGIE